MRSLVFVLLLLPAVAARDSQDEEAPALQKVVDLLKKVQAQASNEKLQNLQNYQADQEICATRIGELTATAKQTVTEISRLVTVQQASACKMSDAQSKIADLQKQVLADAQAVHDLIAMRTNQSENFEASQKDLADTKDSIQRAVTALNTRLKRGSAFLQSIDSPTIRALQIMVQASIMRTASGAELKAFLQTGARKSEYIRRLEEAGVSTTTLAPLQASGKVVQLLNNLALDVDQQMVKLQQGESQKVNEFTITKASFYGKTQLNTASIENAQKELSEQTAVNEKATVGKSVTKELQRVTNKQLIDEKINCAKKNTEYAEVQQKLDQEMDALSKAMDVITSSVNTAPSFLQLATSPGATRVNVASHVVRMLAANVQSTELIQFAGTVDFAIRSAGSDSPVAKVRDLLSKMIDKLQKAGDAEAKHDAFCKTELHRAEGSRDAKQMAIGDFDAKLQEAAGRQTTLNAEMNLLQTDISELATLLSDMTKLRDAEKTEHAAQIDENNNAIKAVQAAIQVLQNFYGNSDSLGSRGGAVIALLENIESDMSETVATMTQVESEAEATFEHESKANQKAQQLKQNGISTKKQEMQDLRKQQDDWRRDQASDQDELAAILEYLKQLTDQCTITRHDPERMKTEIAGLTQALAALESQDQS